MNVNSKSDDDPGSAGILPASRNDKRSKEQAGCLRSQVHASPACRNVLSIMHAFKLDAVDRFVGPRASLLQRSRPSRHAEHATTCSDETASLVANGARVKHNDTVD